MDYYLKFKDEETMWEQLIAAGIVETIEIPSMGDQPAVSVKQPIRGQDLDVIGLIYKPNGETITRTFSDGVTASQSELEPIDGFHANLRGVLSDEQVASLADCLISAPATPYRVWA